MLERVMTLDLEPLAVPSGCISVAVVPLVNAIGDNIKGSEQLIQSASRMVRRAKLEQIEKLQVNTLKWPMGALSKP